jgi:hypothetical protein
MNGISRDEVLLDQDFQALAEFDLGHYCFLETDLDWR